MTENVECHIDKIRQAVERIITKYNHEGEGKQDDGYKQMK